MPDPLASVRPATDADTKMIADYGKGIGAEFDVAKLLANERMSLMVKGTAACCVYVSETNQHVNVFFLFPNTAGSGRDVMLALKAAVGESVKRHPECASWPAFGILQTEEIALNWHSVLPGTTIEPLDKTGEWRIVMHKTKDFVEAMAGWH